MSTPNLVIVESPAKAKTIQKYLGPGFAVLASYGHVRDLIPREGAVDPTANFAMAYEVIDRNEKHVRSILAAAKGAEVIWLATDPDREGEAISWHIAEILGEKGLLKTRTLHRVVFYEITQRAVREAIAQPRAIAIDLVNAQQARRALDYLVGFNLSPLLWRKVQTGLSAGRVQSPALRLICEREQEIRDFTAREYWTLAAHARVSAEAQPFEARLYQYEGTKVEQFSFPDEMAAHAAQATLESSANGVLVVGSVEKKQRRRSPAPPFTTSTLQQEANRKLGFSARRTMQAAQKLYEGVDAGGETIGLITYMRTDAVHLSDEAIADLRQVIPSQFGPDALTPEPRRFKAKSKNAQEAHEAIRPTSAARLPKSLVARLPPDLAKLYELIWKRTVASQMVEALFDTVTATLHPATAQSPHAFRATGSVLVKPGFIAAYRDGRDDGADDADDDRRLPPLVEGQKLKLDTVGTEQHFTEPPPRYTEASLVKTLEEFDIGRPSTYASIIGTLLSREYVMQEGKAFVPTDIGMVVNRFLTEHFQQYVDYDFTAKLEDDLDAVSRGERQWVPLLEDFWGPFRARIDEKQDLKRGDVSQARIIGVEPATGKTISARIGRFGPFVQIGDKAPEGATDAEKPRFASLKPTQRIDTISLDDALALFRLPRKLGLSPAGDEVEVNIGRFGPYAKIGKGFVSLKKQDDPYTIDLETALERAREKAEAVDAATRQTFARPGLSDVRAIKSRFGGYVTDGTVKANLPRSLTAEEITAEQAFALLAEVTPKKGAKGKTKKAAGPKKAKAANAASTPPYRAFPESDVTVVKGAFGKYYVTDGTVRAVLDASADPAIISLPEARTLLVMAARRGGGRKKAA